MEFHNQNDFENKFERLGLSGEWNEEDETTKDKSIELLKNRGLNNEDIDLFFHVRNRTRDYIQKNRQSLSMTYMNGTVIVFGKRAQN